MAFVERFGMSYFYAYFQVKVRLSLKNRVICFIKSPLKMIENTFYFILKALFVLKIFKFL